MIRHGIFDYKIETAGVSATGGTVTYDGDYAIHTFDSSGYFISNLESIDVSILIVGGGSRTIKYNGDSQDLDYRGGGGGGEVIEDSSILLKGVYDIVIGKGGYYTLGKNTYSGQNSSFENIIAKGAPAPPLYSFSGDGADSGSGYSGGVRAESYPGSPNGAGGGGAGAGGDGFNAADHLHGGNGGAGITSQITGYLYGGGGGGTGNYNGANVDSSAGGGAHGNHSGADYNGQNGIVVIKYKYKWLTTNDL